MRDHDDFVIAALLEEGRLTKAMIDEARRSSTEQGGSVGEALVRCGSISARELAIVRAETGEVPFVDLSHYDIDYANTGSMPRSVAESIVAYPLFVLEESTTVGMADPLDLRAVDQVRAVLRCDIEPVLCEPGALRRLIERAYSLTGDRESAGPARVADPAGLTTGKEPIVAAVNQILAQATERGASDIHIGPDEHDLHLRYRIDGTLQKQQGPGLSAHAAIIRRLKVMANLDLTQTRRPQDGKFRFVHNDRTLDVRLSILPTVCGENAVLRLLTGAAALKGFTDLGVPPDDAHELERSLDSPHGMILVTGPTGSGKTTTVYTGLKRLNSSQRNIMTIEDPVEIRMPMIRQVQVNAEIGMTFAGALRSILRQDPDVVFVGEIRDQETARIAVQAALTGHLVLSTLHTNDAAGAIPRLRDFECPPFAINAALLSVVAQRLVRRVCEHCARPAAVDPLHARLFSIQPDESGFVKGTGCARCGNTGFRGRVGVYEVLRVTPKVQRVIEESHDTGRLRQAAVDAGMRLMWRDALDKARLGLTTLEEAARIIAVHATDVDDRPAPSPAPPAESRGPAGAEMIRSAA